MIELDTLSDEKLKELAGSLDEGTLDKIRSGTPVSFEQALAAIAYQSQQPPKKRSWWRRLLGTR